MDDLRFPGDVVIAKGEWLNDKTISNVADALKAGDVIVKGANALDLEHKQAAVLIGHPKTGTAAIALQAVARRRTKLILVVGLEKRVSGYLTALSKELNNLGARGYRLLPLPG
jgi:predicted homoserine dehydrogenase-like protein